MTGLTMEMYAYLASVLATAIVILSAVWVFIVQRRRAMELDVLEQRIPDAARLEDLHQRLLDAEETWGQMQEKLAEAKNVIAQKEQAEAWLSNAREQLQSLEAERQQQERLRVELEELQRRLAVAEERTLTAELERSKAEFEVARLTDEQRRLEPEVGTLREKRDGLTEEIASLGAEHAKLRQMVDAAEASHAEAKEALGRLERQRDELENAVRELRAQQAELEQRISILQGKAAKYANIEQQEKERLGDLWMPVLPRETFSDGIMPPNEEACLDQVDQYLQSLGLRFPRRALNAFHTSLKVADVSPLVVLAGISGTGKSELPRRYAEGMGMHFLNIAVQPRWDSPQDMFGFFNYMEGRYRATELARALVQMDPYFDEDGRGWSYPNGWEQNNLCDQMLLVLLDEMNLARIEYYFSEYLSRLEIRRGVDPEDGQSRRKAEIPLEVGGSGKDDAVLHLYTGTNVLFVGTMNEDETTQALSDKVVDRANVLRFGRPTKLARGTPSAGVQPSRRCTPFGNWQEWLRGEQDLDPTVSDQVDEWVQRLNETMARIRRPFAYRTSLAIRTYIANYPRVTDTGVRLAMADQIEQKILPKFRGLDPSDAPVHAALQELVSLLSELEDGLLVESVNEAVSQTDHLFSWQGVDRFRDDEAGE